MKIFGLLLLLLVTGLKKSDVHVLVVTGGHDFDEAPFFTMFDNLPGITYDLVVQPKANQMIAANETKPYDAIVFYDMFDSITPEQKSGYRRLLEQGTGMIFLHHSLVSYQNWEEFKAIIGGKYYENQETINGKSFKSTYRHDVDIPIKISATHPIVEGINDFTLFDEVYGDCEILHRVIPLLSTPHPESMRHIAWINQYGNSEVIYIQPGHGKAAFTNPIYQKLLSQAIRWSANTHQ